ncbi:MAG TPA: UvrB/UvrC motif-containing protein [Spirochaetia bacterium]|nr:UvrB/UvrC motif-containing protein [Spirochaetia bacterium]
MKCDVCRSEEATIHVKQVTGDDEVELHLCEKCATLKGITTGKEGSDLSISTLLNGVVDVRKISSNSSAKKVCIRCGMTFQNFKKRGRLGCNECYSVFSKEIGRIIVRMFGKTRHTGKYPKRLLAYKTFLIDLEELKKNLEKAVKEENYEEAAKLRDRIKELETASWRPHAKQ